MKLTNIKSIQNKKLKAIAFILLAVAFGFSTATAQATLPTAKSIAAEMGLGWNIGNTMEVPGDPTLWGNQVPTQRLIDSAKAAGFKTIRIPTAWDSHANQSTNVIDAQWMAQVKAVVDYCIKDSLFVILNSHWDGGWLENDITAENQPGANKKQEAYWRQIALAFKDYGRHLLFASANEPNAKNATQMAILNTYHKTFIDVVRATGGNNASRTLVLQGPETDIEKTNQLMNSIPVDHIAGRLMAEVHFYPYQFCLMESDADWGKVFYFWGAANHSTTNLQRNSTWGEESFVDSVFNLMKVKFVDKNIPVILGEFGAMKRTTLNGDDLKKHLASRESFYKYVSKSAKQHGLIPVVWDTGYKGDNNMTVLDRTSGAVYDLGVMNAMRLGHDMPALGGGIPVPVGQNAMKILYSAKDSLYGQIDLGVAKKNISAYDSIIVRAYINGESTYQSDGETQYGFLALNLVTMSKNYTWRERTLGEPVFDSWHNYSIPLSVNDADSARAFVSADPANIDFFALQAYSEAYRGTIYVDYIIFVDNQGSRDTLYTFDLLVPQKFSGNVESVSIIPVANVTSDKEWVTKTKAYITTAIASKKISTPALHFSLSGKTISLSFDSKASGKASINLMNSLGQNLVSKTVDTHVGLNSVDITTEYSGMAILQVNQNGIKQITPIRLR